METAYASNLPLWALLVSLVATPLILMSARSPNLREAWTLIAAAIKFALVAALLPGALAGRVAVINLLEISPGVSLSLRADAFGVFFALIASGLWIVTSIYSIGYMRGNGEKNQTRYYASFALSLSSTIGIAFASNLLTFLIFYELLTLATYPLVIHKESKEAVRAGRMYLAYALTAGLLFLAAVIWTHLAAGSLEFVAGGFLLGSGLSEGEMRALFMLFLVGVGVKSGIMPLHSWLPAAMVAPTPVSALLHAVAVVKSGVFGVIRVVGFVFGPEAMQAYALDAILGILAGATVIFASVIALRQNNLKKRLAYSTVGHLSYIAMGAALVTPAGLTGSILHLSTHAVMKITLFFCAGAIYVHTHKTEISQLNGIGRAMPWTMGAFTIGALGLSGAPPVNGFISKLYLCIGTMERGDWIALSVFLVSGLLNAAYFFPIVVRAFFRSSPDHPQRNEASVWLVAPLCFTAGLAVVLGVFPDFPLPFFRMATEIAQSLLVHSPLTVPEL
jgi:multicomponent Na+:H+ antiporter subunit D